MGPRFVEADACAGQPVVAVRDYDPSAPTIAAFVAEQLTARVPDLIVEHVGSTSVPGLAGKGVIDMLVLFPPGRLPETKTALAALGFVPQTGGFRFPEDRPLREGCIDMDGRLYHVYAHVVPKDDAEAAQFRQFRDLLRGDPALAAAYADEKRALVASGKLERLAYSGAKSRFVRAAIDHASGSQATTHGR